ncbi:MAG: putative F420-dependent oxidoreductase [Gammaproteobacteria bacterium]
MRNIVHLQEELTMATVAAGIGLMEFPFKTMSAFWRWVDLCESGGIDSIWQTDRLVSSAPMLESMSVMAALAGATKRIEFGMNVVSLGYREPLEVAKQCATIDAMSEGRLLPAFGIGSPLSPDWKAMGRDGAGRGKRTDESMEIMRRLWSGEHVDFDGEHFHYRDAHICPLPVQKKLPMWYGGNNPASIRRTARFATGWLGGPEGPEEAAKVVTDIRAACLEAGTRIPDDHYGASFFFRYGSVDEPIVAKHLAAALVRRPKRDPHTTIVIGDTSDIMQRIRAYVAGGVTKFVLRPIGTDDDDLMRQTRLMIESLLPEIAGLNTPQAKAERAQAASA